MAGKDAAQNALYVTNDLQAVQEPRLRFRVHAIYWNIGAPKQLQDEDGVTMQLKLRHSPHFSTGRVKACGEDEHGMIVSIKLDKIDKGIAPGQFTAFYDGELCVGAGVILDTAVDEHLAHRRQKDYSPLESTTSASNIEY